MIKKFKLLIILFLLTSINTVNAREEGAATEYKMTIHKLELCASGSTFTATWNCIGGVDVSGGSVGTAIDIGSAAIGVGEAAATLGNFGKVKTGVTYTHIITTLSREFQITGKTTKCSTAGDGTAATSTTTSVGSGASEASTTTPVSSKLFGPPVMNNLDAYRNIRSVDDAAGSNPQAGGTIVADDLFFQSVGPLNTPYTLKPGQIPTVTMAFATQTAVAARDEDNCADGGSDAEMQANAPTATLTLQGQ